MRNMKKFLALVLAMLMLASTAVMTTSAADEADYTDAANHLNALDVMKGDENGELMLDQGVKRYQASLFFVRALTAKTETAIWNAEKKSATFADVVDYGTAIDYAAGLNIVKGIGGNEFGYNNPIKYQDMIVMAVRALKYETESMQYPYGHILAAQKLGLLDDIDQVNYKADMTRGEVAQLIWNMLNTVVAIEDPLTGEPLYPGDTGLVGALSTNTEFINKLKDRKTLLVEAGFASTTESYTITKFEAADPEDAESYDVITLNNSIEIAAADLDITAETPTVSYMGLDVTLFISYASTKAKDAGFDQGAYDDKDAVIVHYTMPEYEVVQNFGDGAIKVVTPNGTYNDAEAYVVLGSDKFSNAKYYTKLMKWDGDSWESCMTPGDPTFINLFASYHYTTKDGYTGATAANPYYTMDTSAATAFDIENYGEVAYRTTFTYPADYNANAALSDNDGILETGETADATRAGKTVVEVLYTPYEFGQYFARELKYSPDSQTYKFTAVAKYNASAAKNLDGVITNFKEQLVGSNYTLTENTKAVSRYNGELAKDTTLAGEAVQNGDFMFYVYNDADNTLTVAKNLGTFATGRMTATNSGKKTVKISGTNYGFGFEGLMVETGLIVADTAYAGLESTIRNNYIAKLEAGKDNVKFVAVDGNIIYMEQCSNATATDLNFVVISTKAADVAKVLGMTEDNYNKNLTAGYYVDTNGYVAVAVMDLENGGWKLGHINIVEVDNYTWDATEGAYVFAPAANDTASTGSANLATLAWRASVSTAYNGANLFNAAKTLVGNGGIFAVTEEKDGVYSIADIETPYNIDENGIPVESGGTATKLVSRSDSTYAVSFNDTNAQTNKLSATTTDDESRVTLDEGTVIVAVDDDGDVAYRTGVQRASKSLAAGRIFAASSDLIVTKIADIPADWGKGSSVVTAETIYVALEDVNAEYNVLDDEGAYEIVFGNLFDLKTLTAVDSVKVTGEDATADATTINALLSVTAAGTMLYVDENGKMSTTLPTGVTAGNYDAALAYLTENEMGAVTLNASTDFEDAQTINLGTTVDGETIDGNKPLNAINIKVVTLNNTGLDAEDYDFSAMVLKNAVVPDNDTYGVGDVDADGTAGGDSWYYYAMEAELVAEINEPRAGVLDQFILDKIAETVLVPEVDNEDYTDASAVVECEITLKAVADYDDDTNELTMIVVKSLNLK